MNLIANTTTANAVRSARLSAGFTQMELAKRTGLSQGYLSQIEVNLRTPSLKVLRLIAKTTGVTLYSLVQEVA